MLILITFFLSNTFDKNKIHSVELNLLDGQVDTKANNIDNLSSLGKLLSNNFVQTQQKNNLKAI